MVVTLISLKKGTVCMLSSGSSAAILVDTNTVLKLKSIRLDLPIKSRTIISANPGGEGISGYFLNVSTVMEFNWNKYNVLHLDKKHVRE